jgi:uncharacterized membrane protein
MEQLLVWMITAYGLSNIVVYGSIFNGPRNKINKLSINPKVPLQGFFIFVDKMIKCMMCFGFHTGWFLSIILYSPLHEIFGMSPLISWFFDSMFASGAVWGINAIIEWFEVNRPKSE